MADALLVLHALATWTMVGLSLTVRVVHYPLFVHAAGDFAAFHRGHTVRITTVLAVPWLVEGMTALVLPFVLAGSDRVLAIVGLGLVGAIGALTWFGAVGAHHRLAGGYDEAAHRELLRIDTARATLWALRGVVAAVLVLRGVSGPLAIW